VRTLVIAEPGCTAEGDKNNMLRLLETAKACGADVWKPQWTSDPASMCERRHIGRDHAQRGHYERAYGWLAFPVEWHQEFRTRCVELGMQYACSVYLPQDVATVEPFVDYHKVSSFEATDGEMIAAHRALTRQGNLIVSMGMVDDIDDLQNDWRGLRADYLHCVSAYPAPLSAMNLAVIDDLVDGLSDHSGCLVTGAVAVALGAEIIETHYRLDDCNPDNPDYAVAFSPAEFTQYIKNIRDAELMLGDGIKRRQPCEEWAVPYRVVS